MYRQRRVDIQGQAADTLHDQHLHEQEKGDRINISVAQMWLWLTLVKRGIACSHFIQTSTVRTSKDSTNELYQKF